MRRGRKTKSGVKARTAADDKQTAPAELDPTFARVVAAFARDRRVALGKMFSSKAVLNVDGKIFAMFVKGQFVAKLPRDRVGEMTTAGVGRPFDPGHGRLMKEWIAIADRKVPWVALAREARAYVAGTR